MRLALLLPCLAIVGLSVSCPKKLAANEKTATELLPATTVLYGEMAAPPALLDSLLTHPLRQTLESLDAVKAGMKSKQYRQFLFVVGLVELQLDMEWKEAIKALTDGGIYAGVDAKTEGAVILTKARDEKSLEKLVNLFLKMARDEAKKKENPDPIKEHEYRGITAYKINDGVMARVGRWLLLTNKGELAKQIADRYLDDSADTSLAENSQFKNALAAVGKKPTVWAFADTKTLRDSGVAKKLFQEKSDNPVLELLLGGILATAQQTPYATASLELSKDRVAVTLDSPYQEDWIPETREYFFGPNASGLAPTPLQPKQTLLSIEAFRNVSDWWLAKEELFEEGVVAKLTQADSQFSTLFSGLDFGEEVLGSFKAPVQIVVTHQDFENLKTPKPDIRLPSGALILELKDPENMGRRLKVAYQSFMGFINIQLSQQGMPQFDVETERHGEAKIVSATYLPDDSKKGMINYNFSPSLVFIGPRMIISSTRELAFELAELAEKGSGAQKPSDLNTRATLDVGVLKETLSDNREQLVAKNVLEKGHSKQQGEQEIGMLLDLLDTAKALTLQLSRQDDHLQLGVELRFAE